MLMFMGAPAMAATALAGTPFAKKPIPAPLPKPKSMLSETRPCCSLASPAKPVTSSSSPCLAKVPTAMPTSIGVNVQANGTALPTTHAIRGRGGRSKRDGQDRNQRQDARPHRVMLHLVLPCAVLSGDGSRASLIAHALA